MKQYQNYEDVQYVGTLALIEYGLVDWVQKEYALYNVKLKKDIISIQDKENLSLKSLTAYVKSEDFLEKKKKEISQRKELQSKEIERLLQVANNVTDPRIDTGNNSMFLQKYLNDTNLTSSSNDDKNNILVNNDTIDKKEQYDHVRSYVRVGIETVSWEERLLLGHTVAVHVELLRISQFEIFLYLYSLYPTDVSVVLYELQDIIPNFHCLFEDILSENFIPRSGSECE